jgi:hypothetical protein
MGMIFSHIIFLSVANNEYSKKYSPNYLRLGHLQKSVFLYDLLRVCHFQAATNFHSIHMNRITHEECVKCLYPTLSLIPLQLLEEEC